MSEENERRVVPSRADVEEWLMDIIGLPQDTVFLCFQLRSLDPGRFPAAPAGRLSASKMDEVESALGLVLGFRASA